MKSVFFLILFLFGTSSYSKPLTVYFCGSFAEAEACSASCSITPKGYKYDPNYVQGLEFLISEKSKSVMIKTYFGNKFNDSRVMKNCTIFDENNWDCSEEPIWVESNKWFVYQEIKMNNGHYVNGLYNSKETKYKSMSAVCAK